MSSAEFDRYYNTKFFQYLEINERNKKARNIVAAIYSQSTIIDSQNEYSAAKVCISLDHMGIYKSNLIKLFTEICNNKIENLFSVTKAHRDGLICREDIHRALNNNNDLKFKAIQFLISTEPYTKSTKEKSHA